MTSAERIEEGIKLLRLMSGGMGRAAAARNLGLTIEQARHRQAAAERFLKHPRNKNHPDAALTTGKSEKET